MPSYQRIGRFASMAEAVRQARRVANATGKQVLLVPRKPRKTKRRPYPKRKASTFIRRASAKRRRNPKGVGQLSALATRAHTEINRLYAKGRAALTGADVKRLQRLERIADTARLRAGRALQGRGSLYPGKRRKRNPDDATAKYLEEMAAKGYRDPKSHAIPGTARASRPAAARGLLEVQERGAAKRGGARRKAQQGSLFTGEEMGAAQRDLFGRKRNPPAFGYVTLPGVMPTKADASMAAAAIRARGGSYARAVQVPGGWGVQVRATAIGSRKRNPTGYPFSGDPDEGGTYRPKKRRGATKRPRYELDEDMQAQAAEHISRHEHTTGERVDAPKPKRRRNPVEIFSAHRWMRLALRKKAVMAKVVAHARFPNGQPSTELAAIYQDAHPTSTPREDWPELVKVARVAWAAGPAR